MTNPSQFYSKTASAMGGYAGSVQWELRRCGKSRCRCARGQLHGPYARLVWREDGRTHRRYLPRDQVPAAVAARASYRARYPSARELAAQLRELSDKVLDLTALLLPEPRN